MKLKIINVDMYGFCGRDFHPTLSDVGLTVTPLAMETFYGDDMDATLVEGKVNSAVAQDTENLIAMWTAVTEDGRPLQLMEHEVQIVAGN